MSKSKIFLNIIIVSALAIILAIILSKMLFDIPSFHRNSLKIKGVNNTISDVTDDEFIIDFINKYNSTSEYKMYDIGDAYYKNTEYGYINHCKIFMNNLRKGPDSLDKCFQISILGSLKDKNVDNMFVVFPEIVRTLDPTVSDAEIEQCLTAFKKEYSNSVNGIDDGPLKKYKLGDNLMISNMPPAIRSDGSIINSSYEIRIRVVEDFNVD